MKKNLLTESLDAAAASLIILTNLFFRFLPITAVIAIGDAIGWVVSFLPNSRNVVAYMNLRAAFCKTKTPSQLKKVVRLLNMRIGQTVAEMIGLSRMDNHYADKYIRNVSTNLMFEAKEKGRGVIMLTAHFGNWELSAMKSAFLGLPLFVLAREQSMRRVNELLNRLRESKGSQVVRKGMSTRELVKALHDGEMIGMLGDQSGGPNGIVADLFGRPVSTPYGAFRISAKTGAIILPAFLVRENGPYHSLCIEPPIEVKEGEDLAPHIRKYNQILEGFATKYPEQWLWFHRRWKHCPVKKVVILSDGKAGHLNQSMAVFEAFKKYRVDKKIDPSNTELEIIDIKFKKGIYKVLINICGIFSGKKCQGCLKCLKFALTEDCYKKLATTFADVVISTGFSLAGANSIFKYENNAKNAVVMRPGLLNFRKFNMVILHKHDLKKKVNDKKVIESQIVPNTINAASLKAAEKDFASIIKTENKIRIGVLLGGDNDAFAYKPEYIGKMVDGLIKTAQTLKADLLFTTSRRTSVDVETVVKEKLQGNKLCKFLVLANEKNIPNAVLGILANSDVVIVSGESISMVSEAVSSGKKVIVFMGEKKISKATKYEKFLDGLKEKRYVKVLDDFDLENAVKGQLNNEVLYTATDESNLVYLNMWRLGG